MAALACAASQSSRASSAASRFLSETLFKILEDRGADCEQLIATASKIRQFLAANRLVIFERNLQEQEQLVSDLVEIDEQITAHRNTLYACWLIKKTMQEVILSLAALPPSEEQKSIVRAFHIAFDYAKGRTERLSRIAQEQLEGFLKVARLDPDWDRKMQLLNHQEITDCLAQIRTMRIALRHAIYTARAALQPDPAETNNGSGFVGWPPCAIL